MEPTDERMHPIGVVERRTGIPGHVLRAWERRYGVVSPQRTEGGHRLYSDSEVARLDVLGRLVGRGYRVGRLAKMDDAQRLELLGSGPPVPSDSPPDPEDAAAVLEACQRAVEALDAQRLRALLDRAAATTVPLRFMADVISPLLRWVGDSWSDGTLTEAHEHLCSEVVGRLLADRVAAASGAAPGPILVAATLSGERHYLGGLLATLAAASAGWRATWLGPDLPAHAIATAARQLNARGVAVSFVAPEAGPAADLLHQTAELRALLPSTVRLFVGGPGAPPPEEGSPVDGVELPGGLEELHARLREVAWAENGARSGAERSA